MAWGPDLDDYHMPESGGVLPPMPAIDKEQGMEAQEREVKRQRVLEGTDSLRTMSRRACAPLRQQTPVASSPRRPRRYYKNELSHMMAGVSLDEFLFGAHRNIFQDKYEALAAQ